MQRRACDENIASRAARPRSPRRAVRTAPTRAQIARPGLRSENEGSMSVGRVAESRVVRVVVSVALVIVEIIVIAPVIVTAPAVIEIFEVIIGFTVAVGLLGTRPVKSPEQRNQLPRRK